MAARRWITAATLIALGAAVFVTPAFAQSKEEKEKAKQEAKEIKEFIKEKKKELRKIRTEDDIITWLEELGEKKHELLRKEFEGFLRHPMPGVRRESARQLSRYYLDPKAADALLKGGSKDKDEETAVTMFNALGTVEYRGIAKALCRYFSHKSLDVSEAAIEAAGEIKAKVTVRPLISLLKELDSINEDPGGPGGPPMPGPGAGPGGGGDNERVQRKRRLTSVVLQALKDITGERYNKPRDWEKWAQSKLKDMKEQEQPKEKKEG